MPPGIIFENPGCLPERSGGVKNVHIQITAQSGHNFHFASDKRMTVRIMMMASRGNSV